MEKSRCGSPWVGAQQLLRKSKNEIGMKKECDTS